MNKSISKTLFCILLGWFAFQTNVFAADFVGDDEDITVHVAAVAMPSSGYTTPNVLLEGTGASRTFTVSAADLQNDVTITATSGFSVDVTTVKAGEEAQVTVTNTTYRRKNVGKVIMRSGDYRAYINLTSRGSDLEQKDITAGKVYNGGTDETMSFEGFAPGKNGYTVEARVKVDDASKNFYPFATTDKGVGFKGYVSSTGLGLYNGADTYVSTESMSNPSNGGTFYNTDGEYHTYRYAVTPDERVIVYRDGISIDTIRVADLAAQSEWCVGNGEVVENLLKNPGFEGEYDFRSSVVARIEGWDVYPWDQWNTTQGISSSERSYDIDQNNHAVWMDRYMWEGGWAAGEISQIVNVAPNETYSFSCLAKGGMRGDSPLGTIRITDLQNDDNKQSLTVTSNSWQTYATDFETKANTKQIRVSFYLERAAWGASVSSLMADDTKLTGVSREIKQQIGFQNSGADIEYFAFDNTGAYAPLFATLEASTDTLRFTATGEEQEVTVNFENLVGDISVSATSGFTATPSVIAAGTGSATIKVSNDTYRRKNAGQLILRSGDKRTYVQLRSRGSDLEQKDIAANKIYTGGTDESKTFEGFAPGKNGYTVEARVKVDDASKNFYPFATTADGVGFKGYVNATGIGLYNGTGSFTSDESLSNPSNGGTFYNTDGEYHTYRYAVTPDERVIVYRDGICIDSLRVADLAPQSDWQEENGEVVDNLLKNPGFEGEYDHHSSVIARIEGWDVYPWDQYNSYQSIVSDERDKDVDQDNHAMRINRYMWEGGWAAGEVSQIVNVAPNETYSFSCLAKGGLRGDSPLGTIRITDLQNDDNKQSLTVTSNSYQTYATDFETKANTKQIRVSFVLERAAWGASVSGLQADDVKLTGVSRLLKQQIGFENNGAEIEYFTFDNTGAYAPLFATIEASADTLRFTATGEEQELTVNLGNLVGDISVSTTNGFTATPSVIAAGTGSAVIKVTNDTYRRKNAGQLILRSGDKRTYVQLRSQGSDLEQKDITAGKVYNGGNDASKTFEGFAPGKNGYTVEARVKVDNASKNFYPFATTDKGVGFKGYVSSKGLGLYNGADSFTSDESMSNPSNGGTFYNTDGEYHTYRYAVTPDERVIVYRDGICIDSMRVADLAAQSEWCVGNGPVVENLLKNSGFEGEYDFRNSVVARIQGWDVYPWDQWNSYQNIISDERSNDVDQDNHAMRLNRYMWEGGYAAGEISQIVNVAPNETYSFSCLAKGGLRGDSPLGTIRITDLQNDDNKQSLTVTSNSWQTYATDFETKANTKQIRVSFVLERAAWGASVSGLMADDTKLTGVSREIKQQIGFQNNGADIEYFAFDNTGAYAPLLATLEPSVDEIIIAGTGASKTFTVNAANLVGDISVVATSGFSVYPTTIKAGKKTTTITVTNNTYRRKNAGKVIFRSGDKRAVVNLIGYCSDLEPKDISGGPVYTGGTDETKTFDGFNPGEKGYTVEARVKVDDASKNFYPFATTDKGVGFKGYVNATGIGLYNGTGSFVSDESMSNPSNGGTFYNTDGEYHTYRYAVTPDERVIVYRDGITIDSMRVADLAPQVDWSYENGPVVKNLIKNPGFEGEYDHRNSVIARIEGWDVYPWDQYNSYQSIVSDERSNEIDQNNHAMRINRYMWEGGWAAGEVSQIVDVAPNEYYRFSCLAKGGMRGDSPLGTIRITDLQNDDNKQTMTVSGDSYKTYTTEFETKANTKQIRVSFVLERAAWGASVSGLQADDVKLTGVSRLIKQQIGFENNGADIEYFTFDNTGAYAPAFPTLQQIDIYTAVEGVNADKELGIKAKVSDGMLTLTGASGAQVAVYSTNGAAQSLHPAYRDGTGIALPGRGVYIVLVVQDGQRKS
ncbi:MAG: hypothetical protein IKP43_06670, partial [Bacteroidaceae bacterium]|nr:hypothetical protein [Bacteroidaceae bacterium]